MTATLHSEQYRRRRAFSSSVSVSVSASGSASGSRSGSDGELRVESPPAAEVVSGAGTGAAAVVLGTIGEATGAGVGVVRAVKDAKGSAVLSTGESGRGTGPGTPSVEREEILNHMASLFRGKGFRL